MALPDQQTPGDTKTYLFQAYKDAAGTLKFGEEVAGTKAGDAGSNLVFDVPYTGPVLLWFTATVSAGGLRSVTSPIKGPAAVGELTGRRKAGGAAAARAAGRRAMHLTACAWTLHSLHRPPWPARSGGQRRGWLQGRDHSQVAEASRRYRLCLQDCWWAARGGAGRQSWQQHWRRRWGQAGSQPSAESCLALCCCSAEERRQCGGRPL